MRIKKLFGNIKAISLLEVLLASVIFIISVAGLFGTLNAVRKPVINKKNQLAAVLFREQVTQVLYSQVNGSTYYNNNSCPKNTDNTCSDFSLYPDTHEVSSATLSAAGLSWPSNVDIASSNTCNSGAISPCLSYTVACVDGTTKAACIANHTAARSVTLNINWPSL